MIPKRPAAVLLTAAWQILLGLIGLVRATQFDNPVWWIGLTVMALWHIATGVGLYYLCEWARQRAVQLAVFDIFALLQVLFPHPYPFGALLKLGMPLYTIVVLNDRRTRALFS